MSLNHGKDIMSDFTLNEDGQLTDNTGNVIEHNGQPVTLPGYQPQDQIDKAIETRLARQKAQIDKTVEVLKAQADKTPELEHMLSEAQKSQAELQGKLETARSDAEQQVASQLNDAKAKAEKFETELNQEKQARITDQVTNTILNEAGSSFINPGTDIVPQLMRVHSREAVLGDDGKPTGKTLDVFEMSVEENGKPVTKKVPVKEALDIISADPKFSHYLAASSHRGSGGGQGGTVPRNLKRSSMSQADKAAFVGKHGLSAFQALPE